MRIGVVGGGAIGLLTAGYLSRHFPVTLYVRRQIQKEVLQSKGLDIINGPGQVTNLQIETGLREWREDLIIIAVKQPSIPDLLKTHPRASIPGQSLLFLQNGASHLDYLEQLQYEHIFIGLVEHGALKKNDYTIIQRGFGQIKVGAIRGDVQVIQPLLANSTYPFTVVTDWKQAMDEKLLVNTVINPLTSLFRVTNGALTTNPHYIKVMKTVFLEAIAVLGLDNEKEWNHLLQVCQNTRENRSSMLQDIEAGQSTELDAILGVVLQRAKNRNIPVPILEFLYESIKGIEIKS